MVYKGFACCRGYNSREARRSIIGIVYRSRNMGAMGTGINGRLRFLLNRCPFHALFGFLSAAETNAALTLVNVYVLGGGGRSKHAFNWAYSRNSTHRFDCLVHMNRVSS